MLRGDKFTSITVFALEFIQEAEVQSVHEASIHTESTHLHLSIRFRTKLGDLVGASLLAKIPTEFLSKKPGASYFEAVAFVDRGSINQVIMEAKMSNKAKTTSKRGWRGETIKMK